MGTLSKALGTLGGFVAGPNAVIELLVNSARSFIFDTALPPAIALAARIALHLTRHATIAASVCTKCSTIFVSCWACRKTKGRSFPSSSATKARARDVRAFIATTHVRARNSAADGRAGHVATACEPALRPQPIAGRVARRRTATVHRYFVTGTDTDVGKTRVRRAGAGAT